MHNFTSILTAVWSKVAPILLTVWRYVRWPFYIVLALYTALVIYRIPAVMERDRAAQTINYIHAQKITRSDVMGERLPPPPDEEKNNATVEGVDSNNNGVRDDVELAIFALHPDEARVRAAQLQYAMGIQIMMTEVFNSETWKVAADFEERGYFCISSTYPRDYSNDLFITTPEGEKYTIITDARRKEVKDLVLNTQARITAYSEAHQFTTSYGSGGQDFCDVDLASLQN